MALFDWLSSKNSDTQVTAMTLYGQLVRLLDMRTELVGLSAAKQIALNILVPQLSALRIGVYDRATGQRVKNYLHQKLNYDICATTTGFEFWQAFYYNLIRYNNAFALKYSSGSKVTDVRILPSRLVVCATNGSTVTYTHAGKVYASDDIWHVKLNADDGLLGRAYEDELYLFQLARDTERMAAEFFRNGGNVRRIWKFTAGLTPQQVQDLQQFLDAAIKGQLRQCLDVVIPTGLEAQDIQGDLEKGQMIETRRHQSEQILALYGIDLKALKLETIYNVTIVPILENIEQSITKNLLTTDEQTRFKISYVVAGRFRGDTAQQYEIIGKAMNIHSINELREWVGYKDAGSLYDAIINPNTSSAGVNEQRQELAGNRGTDTNAD